MNLSLSEQFALFLERPGIQEFTRKKYYYRLRQFVAANGRLDPSQVTAAMMMDYINKKQNLANASKAILRDCFHALMAYCGVDPNPADALPHWSDKPKRIIVPDDDAVQCVLNEAVRMCRSGEARLIRDGLIFTLSVFSGSRRGELRNMPLGDVLESLKHPENGVYRVYTHGKTGEAVARFTEFHVPLIINYLRLRPVGSSAFFVNVDPRHIGYGLPLSLKTFDRSRTLACRRAGVDVVTFQELRRRVATKIAREQGVDVAALMLNHSPSSGDRVIREFYYDPDKGRADRAALAAFGGMT